MKKERKPWVLALPSKAHSPALNFLPLGSVSHRFLPHSIESWTEIQVFNIWAFWRHFIYKLFHNCFFSLWDNFVNRMRYIWHIKLLQNRFHFGNKQLSNTFWRTIIDTLLLVKLWFILSSTLCATHSTGFVGYNIPCIHAFKSFTYIFMAQVLAFAGEYSSCLHILHFVFPLKVILVASNI